MTPATLAQLDQFDAIIDVRSPAEFADDHIPGAINCPVLDNDERIRVGTLYKQSSPFAARKVGAALAARNIADHIENRFGEFPKSWRPLIYCWRGGQRSGSFSHVLNEIGWPSRRLEGGYKTWRRHVLDNLEALPARLRFQVIGGPTGSAKSRVLEALAERGMQVLHLEALAEHKGSVLGGLPDTPQPSQRLFETRLFSTLAKFDDAKPVFVEAESRKIGRLYVPTRLLERIRGAPCHLIDATLDARVDFLLGDYDYAVRNAAWLRPRLAFLRGMQSTETLARWDGLIDTAQYRQLVAELLTGHYDPLYRRSQGTNFLHLATDHALASTDLSADGIRALATQLIERVGDR